MLRLVRWRSGDWLVLVGLSLLAISAWLIGRDLPQIFSTVQLPETGLGRTAPGWRESPTQTGTRETLLVGSGFPDRPVRSPALIPTTAHPEKTDNPETGLSPTERPMPAPQIPLEIQIPAIDLVAPIKLSESRTVEIDGQEFQDWLVPDDYAAGWQSGSARLGEIGNLVLNGHHNIYGAVFAALVDLQPGDEILLLSEDTVYPYRVTNKMLLPEKYQSVDVRASNADWLQPSDDERLTLVTCWPPDSNTYRLILVARPSEEIPPYPIDRNSPFLIRPQLPPQ